MSKKRAGMNNINDAGLWGLLVYAWKGHITNWLWRSSLERRIVRERVHMQLLTKELKKEIPFIKSIKAPKSNSDNSSPNKEKVFSLWLQGSQNAPGLIKKCWESIRKHSSAELLILDENNLDEYITLPEFIKKKWQQKEIGAAHYSDIIRIELLWKYGGYWMDATNFMTSDFPKEVKDADFLMLMANGKMNPHMFVQNCFIRAKKGDPLLGMWRQAVLHYWRYNGQPKYYFLVQTLFKFLVTYNLEAKDLFSRMPVLPMDPTHELWHKIGNLPFEPEKWRQLSSSTFFQKCSFKPQRVGHGVNELIPGSFAETVINSKFPIPHDLNIKYLSWDSEFFGLKIYEANMDNEEITDETIENLLAQTKSENPCLVYLKIPYKEGNEIPEIKGEKPVDIKLSYSKNLEPNAEEPADNIQIVSKANAKLYRLSLQAGHKSRYKKDERLPQGSFQRLYETWIDNSLNKKIADYVLGYYSKENELLGFVSLSINKDIAKIGLIAVDDNCKHQGIGKALIKAAEFYASKNNCKQLQVDTQLDNPEACSFYESAGFKKTSALSIFHIWL